MPVNRQDVQGHASLKKQEIVHGCHCPWLSKAFKLVIVLVYSNKSPFQGSRVETLYPACDCRAKQGAEGMMSSDVGLKSGCSDAVIEHALFCSDALQ